MLNKEDIDTTIIELKPDQDGLNGLEFLEIDENLMDKNVKNEYKTKDVKPMSLYIKMIVDVALVVALLIYCCTQNYYHVFSLILGLGIGVVPYLSNKSKDTDEDQQSKESDE